MNIFFSLLRSGLYGLPVPQSELPESIDWEAIAALARKHTVLGIIIDAARRLPPGLRPPAETLAKMDRFALRLIQSNLLLDRTAAKLVPFLESHDIYGTLLKGQGIARYYREPAMRQCGDIDFYVGKAHYEKAIRLCRKYLADEKGHTGLTEKHFDFKINGVTVELHRIASKIYSPIKGRRFQEWCVDELEHSPMRRTLTVGGTEITLPSYHFDAIFVFYHAWRHFVIGGIGLRQLCDWTMIFHAHGDEIDADRLKQDLRSFGLTAAWKLFACIAVDHLGLPPEKMPLYDPQCRKKSEKILQEILDGGNFGYYSKAYLRNRNKSGLRLKIGKLRNYTGYFLSLFPLIPVEATFLLLNRSLGGARDLLKPRR